MEEEDALVQESSGCGSEYIVDFCLIMQRALWAGY